MVGGIIGISVDRGGWQVVGGSGEESGGGRGCTSPFSLVSWSRCRSRLRRRVWMWLPGGWKYRQEMESGVSKHSFFSGLAAAQYEVEMYTCGRQVIGSTYKRWEKEFPVPSFSSLVLPLKTKTTCICGGMLEVAVNCSGRQEELRTTKPSFPPLILFWSPSCCSVRKTS